MVRLAKDESLEELVKSVEHLITTGSGNPKKLNLILGLLKEKKAISIKDKEYVDKILKKPLKPLGIIADHKKIKIMLHVSSGAKNQHDLQRIPGESFIKHSEIILLLQELVNVDRVLQLNHPSTKSTNYILTERGKEFLEALKKFRDENNGIKFRLFDSLEDIPF